MFIKNNIQGTLTMSKRKELTIGTTNKAFGDGPYLSVSVTILDIAFGVAPIPWPIRPLIITAASNVFPRTLKQINTPYTIIKIT